MPSWETIFKKQGKYFYEPDERLVDALSLFKKEKVKKVLDLGCGSGRHTVFLADKGFSVTGMDISASGIKLAKEWLKEKKLNAKLIQASCYKKFPFKKEIFDAIISTQVIHHNYHDKIRFTISQIVKVLKTGGLLFLTVPYKKNQKNVKKSRKVENHTYIPVEGEEKGLPHFLYTKKLLKEDFKGYTIISLTKEKGHYCFIGKLKREN